MIQRLLVWLGLRYEEPTWAWRRVLSRGYDDYEVAAVARARVRHAIAGRVVAMGRRAEGDSLPTVLDK